MPNSVRTIIKKCLHKKAINQQEYDKVMRKLDEPIRCKDCKHSYDDIGGIYCSYGVCVDCVVEEEFFCRDGERREEE